MDPVIVYYPAPEQPLAPAELAQVIGSALDGHPKLEAAFRQVLAQRLARATVECADQALDPRAAGHAGGRVCEVLNLQNELANYVQQARSVRGAETGTTRRRGTRAE